jgi:His/Glu/Gln/Arg/opine family amino acid ABC transporter permease subunit
LLTVGAVAFVANVFVGREGFDFGYIRDNYIVYLRAAQVTVYATGVSFAMGIVIGFFIGWARTARAIPLRKLLQGRESEEDRNTSSLKTFSIILWAGTKYAVRRVADGYVELMRGTPLTVQITFIWSVLLVQYPRLPQLSLLAGIIALTLNTGGYQGEIFRAGLQTVHSGQVEAARSIGLSRWGTMRSIVLPQGLRLVIPPLTNEFVGLLKASSLLFVIGVAELTTVGRSQAFLTFKIFEIFALVTGTYLLLATPLSKVVEYVERRYRIPGLGIQAARAARV